MTSILNVINFALYLFGALYILVDYHFALIPHPEKPISYVTHQMMGIITASSLCAFIASLIEFASPRDVHFISALVQGSWAFVSYLDFDLILQIGSIYPKFFIAFPLITSVSSLLLFFQNIEELPDKEENKPVLVYLILGVIFFSHGYASYADAFHQVDTPFLRETNGTYVSLTKPAQPLEYEFQSLIGVAHFIGVYASFSALTGMISSSSASLMVYTMQGIWAIVILVSHNQWGKVADPVKGLAWDVLAGIHLAQCLLSLFLFFLVQRSQSIPNTEVTPHQPSVVASNNPVPVNENPIQQEVSNSQPNPSPSKSANQTPTKSQSNHTPSKSQSNQTPVKEEVSTPVKTETPDAKKKTGSTTKPRVPRLLRELQMSDGWKAKNQGEQHIEEYIKEEYHTK